MKLIKTIAIAGVGVFSLTSCMSRPVRHKVEDYHLDLKWENPTENNFNILQLTDLHISNMANNELHFKFIKNTIDKANKHLEEKNEGKVDLIVITGDLFTFANKSDAIETFDFFDKLEIPWAPTWGNHDEQNYFSVTWLTSELNRRNDSKSSCCMFKDLQDDDVFGNANYVINLRSDEGNKNVVEQLYIFDSNRYNYSTEYFGYDYIHYDQIDWYERQVNYATANLGGEGIVVPSLAFFHIPFPEFEEGYQKVSKGEETDKWSKFEDEDKSEQHHEKGDSTGDPKLNTGLFEKMTSLGSTKGVFVGHNHESDYMVQYNSGGETIKLCFGVKSTNKVYCDENYLGGQIIKINKKTESKEPNEHFKIKRIYSKYSEIE